MEKIKMKIDWHGIEKPVVEGERVEYLDITMVVHPTVRANSIGQPQLIDGSFTVSEYNTGRSIACSAFSESAIEAAINIVSDQYDLVLDQIRKIPKLNP